MPPKTTVPSDCWLAEPAPSAVKSGTTPRINAMEVIRIGRKRRRVASTAASTAGHSCRLELPGEFHNQDRVLGGKRNHQHEPDLCVQVVGETPDRQAR